jgi:hypothetical protein
MELLTKNPHLTINYFQISKLHQFIHKDRICIIEEVNHPIIPQYFNGYVELRHPYQGHYDDIRPGVVELTFKGQLGEKYPREENIQNKEFLGFTTVALKNEEIKNIEDAVIKLKEIVKV